MKKMKLILVAAIIGALTGCVTTSVPTGNHALPVDPDGDGTFKQKTDIKDLPADMQEAIMHGG